MTERYGDWIEAYNGEKFFPLDPREDEIYLENIAHGLSLMSRFNGQCKHFFSVAQHSINCMKEVAHLTKGWDRKKSLKAQALALFHDSSECLGISDICAPAKKFMPEYQAIEKQIQDTVWSAFGLEHTEEEYQIVKNVDSAMAAYEAKYLMKCKYWNIDYSYLVQGERKSYIDLSYRDMRDVEDEFIGYAELLLAELA